MGYIEIDERLNVNADDRTKAETDLAKAWMEDSALLEYATVKQAFRLGFFHGRVSGSAETGDAIIAAVDEAKMEAK